MRIIAKVVMMVLASTLLLCLCSCSDSVSSEHLTGTWSNQKDGFKTVTLGLRGDGRGLLSGGIFSMMVRWQPDKDGIHIKATAPGADFRGHVVEYSVIYDRNNNQLVLYDKEKGNEQVLSKISADEPEDLEKKALEAILAQKQKLLLFEKELINVSSRDELFDMLPNFTAINDDKLSATFVITDPQQDWEIRASNQVFGSNKIKSIKFMVSVLTNSVETPTEAMTLKRYRKQVIPALPVKFQMKENVKKALEVKAEDVGAKTSIMKRVGASLWDIEEYRETMLVSEIDNVKTLIELLQFTVSETFQDSSGPYQVMIIERPKT